MKHFATMTGACLIAATTAGQASFSMFMPGDLGPNLLIDEAQLGGSDLRADLGTEAFVAWEIGGLWNPGDQVSLTGLALPIWANNENTVNNTQNGTFTLEIYGLGGGGNPEQFGGLADETLLGSTTIDFDLFNTGVFVAGAVFDSPINFIADASGFAFRLSSDGGSIRLKNGPQPSNARRININNGNRVGNANGGNQWGNFTFAGTAIPAPSTAALLGLGGLAAARRRR
ncbi:MAG: PEP-CTERM sorting domain-containing protein [Planctomycetota bacterium]